MFSVNYINIYIFFAQILAALNDPERKYATIKDLLDNVVTLEDEHGQKHELVNLGGFFFNVKLFRTRERLFVDTKRVLLRDDDVIVITFPKTGDCSNNLFTF